MLCATAPEETMEDSADEQHAVQAPLDYVMQNLQCRVGNRAIEASPFHLSGCGLAFMGGPGMWNKTAAAVVAALTEDDVAQITHLQTLKPLWDRFDDKHSR